MKIGYRKPSVKKSLSSRTTGRAKRAIKSSVNPLYGKKGMGVLNDPKKAVYNKVYNKTSYSVFDAEKSDSNFGCSYATVITIIFVLLLLHSIIDYFLSFGERFSKIPFYFLGLAILLFVIIKIMQKRISSSFDEVPNIPDIDEIFYEQPSEKETTDTDTEKPIFKTMVSVVGMNYRKENAEKALGMMVGNRTDQVKLVREPTNPYDHLAIKVYLFDIFIGYIPRKGMKELRKLIQDESLTTKAVATEDGFNDDGLNCLLKIEIYK
ncbi:TPA: HIRAN domain-containing protein [Streptococcus suis]